MPNDVAQLSFLPSLNPSLRFCSALYVVSPSLPSVLAEVIPKSQSSDSPFRSQAMQVSSYARRLTRALKPQAILLNSAAYHTSLPSSSTIQSTTVPYVPHQCSNEVGLNHFSRCCFHPTHHITCSTARPASFSTAAAVIETETAADKATSGASPRVDVKELSVKELHEKILESINVKRTMSPNAWLWTLVEKCENRDDVKLLFDTLQNLRRFRLSNLRIHDNFNDCLCREVAKACARVGDVEYGKKALWKHNVYGLTPSIASGNHLLNYAKNNSDVELMVEVMKLLKQNDVVLLPSTADTVLSICYNSNNWELMSKYGKMFLRAGVKLRKTAFDSWMDFAAKRGDTESLWKIERSRSETMRPHTIISGFSCAKGLILERKPEDAAAVIQVLNQTLPEPRKADFVEQLQKLVSEWPFEVVKHKKEEDRKPLVAALKSDIPAMITALLRDGLEVNVNVEDLTSKEIPC